MPATYQAGLNSNPCFLTSESQFAKMGVIERLLVLFI